MEEGILDSRRLLLLAICLSFVAGLLLSFVAVLSPPSAAGCSLLKDSRASHTISAVVTHASSKSGQESGAQARLRIK